MVKTVSSPLMNFWWAEARVPAGAKAHVLMSVGGTAEAVPLQNHIPMSVDGTAEAVPLQNHIPEIAFVCCCRGSLA